MHSLNPLHFTFLKILVLDSSTLVVSFMLRSLQRVEFHNFFHHIKNCIMGFNVLRTATMCLLHNVYIFHHRKQLELLFNTTVSYAVQLAMWPTMLHLTYVKNYMLKAQVYPSSRAHASILTDCLHFFCYVFLSSPFGSYFYLKLSWKSFQLTMY